MRQSEKQSAAVAALLAALSLIASRKLLSLTIAFGNNATRMPYVESNWTCCEG